MHNLWCLIASKYLS